MGITHPKLSKDSLPLFPFVHSQTSPTCPLFHHQSVVISNHIATAIHQTIANANAAAIHISPLTLDLRGSYMATAKRGHNPQPRCGGRWSHEVGKVTTTTCDDLEGAGVADDELVKGGPTATAGDEIKGEGAGAYVLAEETTLLEGIMGGVVVVVAVEVMRWLGLSSWWRSKLDMSRRRPAWRGLGQQTVNFWREV